MACALCLPSVVAAAGPPPLNRHKPGSMLDACCRNATKGAAWLCGSISGRSAFTSDCRPVLLTPQSCSQQVPPLALAGAPTPHPLFVATLTTCTYPSRRDGPPGCRSRSAEACPTSMPKLPRYSVCPRGSVCGASTCESFGHGAACSRTAPPAARALALASLSGR